MPSQIICSILKITFKKGMLRLILIEEILHKKMQEYAGIILLLDINRWNMHDNYQCYETFHLKKSFVGFKGTTRWSVRSTSLHLKEWVKRYFECLFCSGCRQLQKSLKMLDWKLNDEIHIRNLCFWSYLCFIDRYKVKSVWFGNMPIANPSVFPVQSVLVLYISDSTRWFLSILHVLRNGCSDWGKLIHI